MRFYQIDLLDFYRGTLSTRRLVILLRQLPAESALTRALNGGSEPLSRTEHLLADIWSLSAKQDHPVRAEIEAKARNARKVEKHKRMQAKYQHVLEVTE